MPSLDQVECISPENPIQLLLNQRMLLLIKYTFENLGNEVNHGLEKVLILENHLTLAMAQQYAHIHITDLLAFLLQMVCLVSQFFKPRLVALCGLKL